MWNNAKEIVPEKDPAITDGTEISVAVRIAFRTSIGIATGMARYHFAIQQWLILRTQVFNVIAWSYSRNEKVEDILWTQ